MRPLWAVVLVAVVVASTATLAGVSPTEGSAAGNTPTTPGGDDGDDDSTSTETAVLTPPTTVLPTVPATQTATATPTTTATQTATTTPGPTATQTFTAAPTATATETPRDTRTVTSTATVASTATTAPEPTFTVVAVSFNETDPVVGRPVRISAVVANRADERSRYIAELVVDGELSATDSVRLGVNESGEVAFVREFTEAGSHEVAIGSTPVDTLVVSPADADAQTTGPPATGATAGENGISVLDATSVYSWVRAGYDARIRVTIANRGSRTATRALVVTVDGDPVTTRNVSLDPGTRTTLSLTFPAAEGQVSVEGVSAGRLRVGNGTVGPSAAGPTAESGPGFGVGTALLALVGATLLLLGRAAGR